MNGNGRLDASIFWHMGIFLRQKTCIKIFLLDIISAGGSKEVSWD